MHPVYSWSRIGNLQSDPATVCEIFNTHFTEAVDEHVIPNLFPQSSNNKPTPKVSNFKKFYIRPIDDIELSKIISSFENSYSCGYDEVPMAVLKKAKLFLIKPIVHLINCSFITGIFPDQLKISRIKPIFKKGSEYDPSK